MEKKQRVFIYDRKELVVLILLGLVIAIFSFTLGVHLGKEVGEKVVIQTEQPVKAVGSEEDTVPNRLELAEQAQGVSEAVEDALEKSLHDEVARTGMKLDKFRQVELPDETLAPESGKTSLEYPAPTKKESLTRADAGVKLVPFDAAKYLIQVGSHPNDEEAKKQETELKSVGLEPLIRTAEIMGKGTWYRVFLGGFESREDAEKAGKHYVDLRVVNSFILVNNRNN